MQPILLHIIGLKANPPYSCAVEIKAESLLQLMNGAQISSGTSSGGNAGNINIKAGEMIIDGQGSHFNGVVSSANCSDCGCKCGDTGSVEITVDGLLKLVNGAFIYNSSRKGFIGSINIKAGEMTVDGQRRGFRTGVESIAANDSEGNASSIEITVGGLLQLLNGGAISSKILEDSEGNAGSVTVNASEMIIDDQGNRLFTGVASNAEYGSKGNAGSVQITVDGLLQIINQGYIVSSTYAKGNAGSVHINAGKMIIDAQGSESLTGVVSNAYSSSEGNAGFVEISVDGLLQLLNGAQITSSTWSKGNAKYVIINAGSMTIDDQDSGNKTYTVVASTAESASEGDAGFVKITVDGLLQLINGGSISTNTSAGGNAGNVEITVNGLLELINGGVISSSTFSTGDAGSVIVKAGELTIDHMGGDGSTWIVSIANSGSEGDAFNDNTLPSAGVGLL